MSFNKILLRVKHKLGLLTKDEIIHSLLSDRERFLVSLPKEARQEISTTLFQLDDLATVSDMNRFMSVTTELSYKLQSIAAKYGPEGDNTLPKDTYNNIKFLGGLDDSSYRPQSSRAWNFFINPFSVFSFFAEHHWAVKAAIEIIMTEVLHDGYSLVPVNSNDVITEEEVIAAEQKLKMVNMDQLRLDILKHYLVYGNVLVLPHFNMFPRNLTHFELLIMDRAMPVWDKVDQVILGWDYWYGMNTTFYAKRDLLHLCNPSLKHPDLGLPPLTPLVTDVESDLFASALNRTVMDKAGMVGVIISTDMPVSDSVLAGKKDKFSAALQKEIQHSFSGIKGANSILVSNYVKAVHKLSQIGEFDASFMKFRIEVAKAICIVLQVPPEKISVNRSQGLQYQSALVEDSINATFDKAIAAHMTRVDCNFINKFILPLMGITRLKLSANGRYGSLTLNGARAGLIASQTGGLFTGNEERTIFYGVPPLPAWDKRGNEICDNSKNRDQNSKPARYAPKNEQEALEMQQREDDGSENEDEEEAPKKKPSKPSKEEEDDAEEES